MLGPRAAALGLSDGHAADLPEARARVRGRAPSHPCRFRAPCTRGRRRARSAAGARGSLGNARGAPHRRRHIVGAVRRPGLYELAEGSRIDEAIRKAGGPKPKAALELVNLAAPVADGQQIVVPARGDITAARAAADPAQSLPTAKVHLNTATLEQLDSLPGVGPVTAQRILDYRTEHGAFQSVEELDAVSGIGPARLEQLKPLVQL